MESEEMADITLVCIAGGTWANFRAADTPDYADFVEKFKDNITTDAGAQTRFTFEINKGQKCSLNCEADYENMILLCRLLVRQHVLSVFKYTQIPKDSLGTVITKGNRNTEE